eukprot:2953974-Rhodomonas_salina.1
MLLARLSRNPGTQTSLALSSPVALLDLHSHLSFHTAPHPCPLFETLPALLHHRSTHCSAAAHPVSFLPALCTGSTLVLRSFAVRPRATAHSLCCDRSPCLPPRLARASTPLLLPTRWCCFGCYSGSDPTAKQPPCVQTWSAEWQIVRTCLGKAALLCCGGRLQEPTADDGRQQWADCGPVNHDGDVEPTWGAWGCLRRFRAIVLEVQPHEVLSPRAMRCAGVLQHGRLAVDPGQPPGGPAFELPRPSLLEKM